MTSGPGQLDDRCDSSIAVAALCGDGLTCLGSGFGGAGTCVAWCAGDRSCPVNKTCKALRTTFGVAIKVCLPCSGAYTCGAGQTCASLSGEAYSCVPAGTQTAGTACDASVGASVTCGERLVCLATDYPKLGTCTPFCDAAHPCKGGGRCEPVLTTKGVTLMVCR
jgi:hypothetical protein